MGKKVEAWAVESPGGGFVVNMRRTSVPDGFKEHRLVPASSEAEVRELRRVYRAAVKWHFKQEGRGWGDIVEDRKLINAIERSLKPRNKKPKVSR